MAEPIRRAVRTGLIVAAWLSASGAGLRGQGQSPPTIPVHAPIVHVDVVVTGRQGRPVTHLTAADFTLYVDGRAVPLAAFRAPAQTVPLRATEPPSRVAGAAAPGSLAEPPGGPSTFVVYVDNWNLTPAGRARVLSGLSPFLEAQVARGGIRVLVASASAEAQALSPLTSDPDRVASALRATLQEATHGQITYSEERHAMEVVRAILGGGAAGCADLTLLQAPIRFQAEARSRELERTLTRLEGLIEALGTLPGSKALFYVSEGLEQRPGIDLFHQLGDICPSAVQTDFSALFAPMQEYDMSRALSALAAHANAARVSFYPIDGSGVRAAALADASWVNRRFVPSEKTGRIRAQNLKSGQEILADETGGSAIFDANEIHKPLERLADQMRGAYALGFAPDHEPEGRVHSVRVELMRKGLRIRSMPSYFHGDRAEPGAGRTLAALLVGLEQDLLGAEVSVELPPLSHPPAEAARNARVRISVPLASLSAIEDAGGRHGRLRVLIAMRRPAPRAGEPPVEVREKVFDVPLSAGSQEGADRVRHDVVVEVPLGAEQREIAVGVQDAASQRATYRLLRTGP